MKINIKAFHSVLYVLDYYFDRFSHSWIEGVVIVVVVSY